MFSWLKPYSPHKLSLKSSHGVCLGYSKVNRGYTCSWFLFWSYLSHVMCSFSNKYFLISNLVILAQWKLSSTIHLCSYATYSYFSSLHVPSFVRRCSPNMQQHHTKHNQYTPRTKPFYCSKMHSITKQPFQQKRKTFISCWLHF